MRTFCADPDRKAKRTNVPGDAFDQANHATAGLQGLSEENRQDWIEHLRGDVGEQAGEGQEESVPRETGEIWMSCRSCHEWPPSMFQQWRAIPQRLRVGNQPREAFVHVVLMMTVKERWARVFSHEIDPRRRKSRHAERILHQAEVTLSPIFVTSKVWRCVCTGC